MAELTFSLKDLDAVERICRELDPEEHPLTKFHVRRVRDLADRLDLLTFMRRSIRGELMVGLAARAMGDALMRVGVAEHRAVRGWIEEDWWDRYGKTGLRKSDLQHNLGRVGDEFIGALGIMNRWWGTEFGDSYRALYELLDLAHEEMFGSSELEPTTS